MSPDRHTLLHSGLMAPQYSLVASLAAEPEMCYTNNATFKENVCGVCVSVFYLSLFNIIK